MIGLPFKPSTMRATLGERFQKKFGVYNRAIQRAIERGDLNTTRSNAEATKLSHSRGERKPAVFQDTFLKSLSERQSLHNSGGKCQWYEVSGQKVQGTWERDVATKLDEMGVRRIKLKTGADILWYELDGKRKAYTPDFLPTGPRHLLRGQGVLVGQG